ncbi:MAG: HAMP domain-containing sensor histidine kinase [bacterium]|nr:HAMP domain-containing sensor histidine kinase [bacterium]
MKTGRKISLLYSGITIGLVLITAWVFYFCASNYTENVYYQYLEEKAHAVAEEKFSQDELDPVKYRNVVIRRQNSIPTSQELFINVANRALAEQQLAIYLDPDEIQKLFANQTVNFKKSDEVGTSFIYYDNTGTFAVVVLSRNPFIDDINNTLLWGILLLIVLATLVLYFISRLYAIRMLDRIDQDYQTEKLFVNNASHEINNPLTAIQGECEVALMMEHTPDQYRDILERISQETNRIIHIMRQLLQFSQARGGKLDASMMQMVSVAAILQHECKGNILLKIVKDHQLLADAELLRIALHNLINNAVKYSDGHPVTVWLNSRKLEIEDQGIGIPSAEVAHIFQPFYRASNATSSTGKGIGLALSKAILTRFGAKISVSSEVGKGTRFMVCFS